MNEGLVIVIVLNVVAMALVAAAVWGFWRWLGNRPGLFWVKGVQLENTNEKDLTAGSGWTAGIVEKVYPYGHPKADPLTEEVANGPVGLDSDELLDKIKTVPSANELIARARMEKETFIPVADEKETRTVRHLFDDRAQSEIPICDPDVFLDSDEHRRRHVIVVFNCGHTIKDWYKGPVKSRDEIQKTWRCPLCVNAGVKSLQVLD